MTPDRFIAEQPNAPDGRPWLVLEAVKPDRFTVVSSHPSYAEAITAMTTRPGENQRA
jgi:hypothetical protein